MKSKLRGVLYLFIVMSIVLVAGCGGQLHVKVEEIFEVDALTSSLRIGDSTREDVLAALGIPNGRGRIMLPIDEKPRTLWFYYYEEDELSIGGGESISNVIILFVYFNGDLYDGSLWSSTFPGARASG